MYVFSLKTVPIFVCPSIQVLESNIGDVEDLSEDLIKLMRVAHRFEAGFLVYSYILFCPPSKIA